MILHRLTANQASFRPITFTKGLNVILAEKAASSSKKDTRNGVGKTTLVEILMFCLGDQATKGRGVMQTALQSWKFSLELTMRGSLVTISRSIEDPARIWVDGNIDSWKIQPDFTELTGIHSYEISRWQDLLGWALFDLDPSVKTQNSHPVPNGLLACFIRLEQSAYERIDFHNTSKSDGKELVNIMYLLGLDWEFIGKIKKLRQTLKEYRTAKSSIEKGAFSGAVGNIEEIRMKQLKVQAEIAELEKSLESYDFSPQYERLQNELNELTRETLTLSNRIAFDKRKLAIFQHAVQEEQDASPDAIERLYREVGLAFPDSLRRTLAEVHDFHKTIVLNRQKFLDDEITRLGKEIHGLTSERDEKSKLKGEKTAQLASQDIYGDLRTHRDQLAELKSQEHRHEEWINGLKELDDKIGEIETEIETEQKNAKKDFSERKKILDPFFKDFSDFTSSLYGKPGKIGILPENDDYSISIEMDRGGSDGVRLMGIFCFDLALLKTQSRFSHEVSFLVHDTPIFDPVDDRQRALALELAARETTSIDGQYICTMNSDKVPREHFSQEFDFDAHVIRTLSDKTPSDSLLGIRFEVDP